MKLALIGYGKMGREIESLAKEQEIEIAGVFDIDRPPTPEALAPADVCIEFTHPDSVMANLRTIAMAGKDAVVGTTGWFERIGEVRPWFDRSGLIYSANFSLGVNAFFRIVKAAAGVMTRLEEYDPFIEERHHRQKADSPSGTALRLAELVSGAIPRKAKILADTSHGRIDESALHVVSVRAGSIPGTHTVGFDSAADTIELIHTARSRRGFASGAIVAARWVRGRCGVYTMDDVDF